MEITLISYHNENYRGNNRGRRPYRGSQQRGRGQQNNYRGQFQGNRGQFNPSHGSYNNNYYGSYQVEVAMAMVVIFIDHTDAVEAITEAITIINIINIIPMMVDPSLNNMVYHAPFVEVSIILLTLFLGRT